MSSGRDVTFNESSFTFGRDGAIVGGGLDLIQLEEQPQEEKADTAPKPQELPVEEQKEEARDARAGAEAGSGAVEAKEVERKEEEKKEVVEVGRRSARARCGSSEPVWDGGLSGLR